MLEHLEMGRYIFSIKRDFYQFLGEEKRKESFSENIWGGFVVYFFENRSMNLHRSVLDIAESFHFFLNKII